MSSIEDLRYYLASADCSMERIEEYVQVVVRATVASGIHPDYVIAALCTMLEFEASMARIERLAGESTESVQAIAHGIEAMAAIPEAKPIAKAPYYQRNKQTWWK